MILNISLIHIFELITLLLVVGKLLQIRRLYRQSGSVNPRHSFAKGSTSKISTPEQPTLSENHKFSNQTKNRITRSPKSESSFLSSFKENYAFHHLPLPEVSFTEGLPLPEVSYSYDEEQTFSASKENSSKAILTNYIDDLFFESPRTVFPKAKVVDFNAYKLDANAEDEFITVQDEHDEIVRAFDSLEKNLYLVR